MKLVLSFQGVLVREYALDRPVLLTDLRSTNGAYVNGHRATEAELRPNDWISIGKHILTFKAGAR